ncbi:hypothetical protein TanjilG_05793 [Lupinus angustifolius]|uniref:XS domain-containing protein n=1 Tax=Lupinus angustifolius TaxID=3871 RepID=A0A394BNG6_LUPAN|nr:PREDICTED: protein SUPPRESSOR OF GENE SILENCING 3-like [Lupinus angustifolius]XP_019463557.1 PREDICTED: protein SUPPRESSOR OF GENE SILENCING 3-like [Lupinus angustifolius]XP_019463558.1 PREDICTED: protein SUPPRESSOR OF GENE SILENCING 3-like [Lupinus angustifolius]OIW00442.1 hypothetical protein TanjilG_05792 [Lupinus angustifolius]OIW00443.1 hypothetical protein TanjilG_05793 [Lupinus angustifolius]
MSSRRGALARPFPSSKHDGFSSSKEKGITERGGSSSKGKVIVEPQPKVEKLSQGLVDINIGRGQDDGEWEVQSRKSKNRARAAANTRMAQNPSTWNHVEVGRGSGNPWQTQNDDFRRAASRGNGRPQFTATGPQSYSVNSNPLVRAPLEKGWNWKSRTIYEQSISGDVNKVTDETALKSSVKNTDVDDEVEEDFDDMEDTDDDLLSDDNDSDYSQKSHETYKNNKWFKKFFATLDTLTVEQINEPDRQWHCPACQGGPGSIEWYRGVQPLMNHCKTKGSKRVKIHREFATILDEELYKRGTSVIPFGEVYGKWKGLKCGEKDHEIVWPPMVVIQNTQLEQVENEKWIGMGNQELLEYFSTYAATKARHAYSPQGHRGMSLLIFEKSPTGYIEAERLHKHFVDEGTGRDAWLGRRKLFLPGGQRQLYGYMALKEDMNLFNRHSQGKTQLKYEMKSFLEMVVKEIRKMGEDNEQLHYWVTKAGKYEKHKKILEESLSVMAERMRQTMDESHIVRLRTKKQHDETSEELYLQEQFFKDQIRIIHDLRNAKEEDFERLQQEKREEMKQSSTKSLNEKEHRIKVDEYEEVVKIQGTEMSKYVAEEEKLRQSHEDNIATLKLRYLEEEVQLEKKFNEEKAKLMEKYAPSRA